jgi:hypothetical protein
MDENKPLHFSLPQHLIARPVRNILRNEPAHLRGALRVNEVAVPRGSQAKDAFRGATHQEREK